MAKANFNKVSINNNSVQKTHADLQKENNAMNKTKNKPTIGRPVGSKSKNEPANVSLSVAFTPTQKQQLIDYAKEDDRTAGYIIKKLLIKEGIIDANK
jgi:hypothetical protein